MNIWTQFLPGFRESRVPLAVGALWVAAAGLLIRHLPSSVLDGELAGRLDKLIGLLPGPVAGAAALFGVYLLGIILHEVGAIVVRIVVGVASLAPAALILLLVLVALRLFLLLLLAGAVLVAVAYHNWRRVRDVPFSEYLSQVLNRLLAKGLRVVASSWQAVVTAWDPSREQIGYILREESSRALAGRPELRKGVLDDLPVRRLAEVARAVSLQDSDVQRGQPQSDKGKELTVSSALRRAKVDSNLPPIIRAAISDRISVNSAARHAFVSSAINTSLLRGDIKDRVDRAHVHLRAHYESIYDQYDRLRSEGEFRIAVAVPLGALLVAISFLLSQDFRLSTGQTGWLYAGCGLASLLMLAAGGTKKTEASQLLYSSIRQQLVQNEYPSAVGAECRQPRVRP